MSDYSGTREKTNKKPMNTKNKGDILADRIEAIRHDFDGLQGLSEILGEALEEYRRPWTLGRSVNGFTLADGQEWHRQDWTEDMLPVGWRPLTLGEQEQEEDEYYLEGKWHPTLSKCEVARNYFHRRTRRPIPKVAKPILTPEQIADGWVKWRGGECPVWGGSKPTIMCRSGETSNDGIASAWVWHNFDSSSCIIAYRPDPYEALKKAHAEGKVIQYNYGQHIADWCDLEKTPLWVDPIKRYRVKPAPVMVPLGPKDVSPNFLFKPLEWSKSEGTYVTIASVRRFMVCFNATDMGSTNCDQGWGACASWAMLRNSWQISRDGGKTWQRCEKEGK